jgi:hypothetical protein
MSDQFLPCRACGNTPHESAFRASSNSFIGTVLWTRIECRGHDYVSFRVEAESRGEALRVWNNLMRDSERKETINVLREICEYYGDNDWPDNLHLADIIEKHLFRHLDNKNV